MKIWNLINSKDCYLCTRTRLLHHRWHPGRLANADLLVRLVEQRVHSKQSLSAYVDYHGGVRYQLKWPH